MEYLTTGLTVLLRIAGSISKCISVCLKKQRICLRHPKMFRYVPSAVMIYGSGQADSESSGDVEVTRIVSIREISDV